MYPDLRREKARGGEPVKKTISPHHPLPTSTVQCIATRSGGRKVQTEPAIMSLLEVVWSYSDWILVAVLLMSAIYTLGTWNYNYFSKQNIPYVKPIPFLGNMAPVFFGKMSNTENVNRLYRTHRGQRVTGTFQYGKPSAYINDPELIKTIMIKDFDHFTDHHFGVSPDRDELFTETLIFLRGWYSLHNPLSFNCMVEYVTTLEGDENSTNTNLHLKQDEEHVWPGPALRATDG
uniref:Cytochrome P450 n=1 Tax=Timema monikensis TaxID=170555 RepID=A0A7R9EBC2_9NEOP|nr:unnamed protein product [Timema monikensis]